MPDPERERIVAAFGRAAGERGYVGLDIDVVARYAGIPAARVEAHFATVDAGVLATQDAFWRRLRLDAEEACSSPSPWVEKVREAVGSVVESLVEANLLARVLAVEVGAIGPAASEHRFESLEGFARLLEEGRRHHPRAGDLPRSIEQVLVGGVASVIGHRLLGEEASTLLELKDELVELVLIPYVGPEEARRVATESS